jgi:tetratricopeptide (TPR) repeat protein
LKVYGLILAIFIVSCSSKTTKTIQGRLEKNEISSESLTSFESKKKKIIKRFNPYSLDGLNFKKVKQKKYYKDKDFYGHSLVDSNILGKETLYLYSSNERKKILNDLKDPISVAGNYCYLKRFNRGLSLLDKVYPNYKTHSRFWNQMGICYFLKGEYRKADLYLHKSLDFNNKYVPALNNLGVLYNLRSFYQKSFETFNESSKMSSFSMTPILNKAQILLKFNLFPKACPIFKTLHREDSFNKYIGHGLGTCYLFQGDYRKAWSIYRDLKINIKEDEIPYVHYLVSLKLLGRYDEIKNLTSNIKVNFKNKYARRVFDFVRSK